MKAIVIGSGSIGRRHVRNLCSLGVTGISLYDVKPERAASVAEECGVTAVRSIAEAFAQNPESAFICTPPVTHLPLARQAVAAGCHVFVEKPLTNQMDGVDELLVEAHGSRCLVYVGYNLRFHPGLVRLKQMLDHGTIGMPLGIRAEFGQYLPDWRPDEDYRASYTAKESLGGGIILDASHELDYIRWLAGAVESVSCASGRIGGLEMDAEDTAEIILKMRSGIIAQVHVDCTQRHYTRWCKVAGTEGTLIWDYLTGVRHYDAKTKRWQEDPIAVDPNFMYVKEVEHFLACARGEARPLVDGDSGKAVLAIALAAKRAAAEGREVTL